MFGRSIAAAGSARRGQRYQITYEVAKTEWQRTRVRASIKDFRFHDIRHDVGTKTVRETGNLKLVQKVLNHRVIKTTTRYAVLDDEVSAALERVARSRKKRKTTRARKPTKSKRS